MTRPDTSSRIWYCARLSADQIAAGHLEIIRRRFEEAVGGAPAEGACLFAVSHTTGAERLREDDEDHPHSDASAVFFSPVSISLVPELISEYAAEPSEPPERTRAALLVGQDRDWELLPHSSH